MKLYLIHFDGEPDYVEAPNFAAAIELWRVHLIADNEPGDIEPDVQPESVTLVHEEPVVRSLPGSEEMLRRCDGYGLPGPDFEGVSFCRKGGARAMWDLVTDLRKQAEKLEQFKHADDHGCCSGDCPHKTTAQCTEALIEELKHLAALARGEDDGQ